MNILKSNSPLKTLDILLYGFNVAPAEDNNSFDAVTCNTGKEFHFIIDENGIVQGADEDSRKLLCKKINSRKSLSLLTH